MQENINYFYSAGTNSFYPAMLRPDYEAADSWPTDATPVSDRWYEHLLAGQAEGKCIAANEYGQPVLADPAPPTMAELIKQAEEEKQTRLRAVREKTQLWQTQLSLGIISDADKQRLTDWMRYAQAVDAVVTDSLPDSWPEQPE